MKAGPLGSSKAVHANKLSRWADGGYTGGLVEYCFTALSLMLAIISVVTTGRRLVVVPKRWIVKRFFAHLMRTRRLVRDFERRTGTAEAIAYWSMTLLMTCRLARPRPFPTVNRPGWGSASQPRATRRFDLDRSTSTSPPRPPD